MPSTRSSSPGTSTSVRVSPTLAMVCVPTIRLNWRRATTATLMPKESPRATRVLPHPSRLTSSGSSSRPTRQTMCRSFQAYRKTSSRRWRSCMPTPSARWCRTGPWASTSTVVAPGLTTWSTTCTCSWARSPSRATGRSRLPTAVGRIAREVGTFRTACRRTWLS